MHVSVSLDAVALFPVRMPRLLSRVEWPNVLVPVRPTFWQYIGWRPIAYNYREGTLVSLFRSENRANLKSVEATGGNP